MCSCTTLLLVAVVTLYWGATHAQVYGPGACPLYQTSDQFNVDKISQMVDSGGLVPYLLAGTSAERQHTCQYLNLQDSNRFTYTYRDASNSQRTINGRYDIIPSAFKDPGYLRLETGQLGILGSDVTGNVRLYPILIEGGKTIFAACTNFGFFHAEYAYAFLPPGTVLSGDVGAIKRDLVKKGVPLADNMSASDQTCFEYDEIMKRRVPPNSNQVRDAFVTNSVRRHDGAFQGDKQRNPLRDDVRF